MNSIKKYFTSGSFVPIINKFPTTKDLKHLSAEQLQEFYKKYRASMSVSNGLTCTNAFDDYVNNRVNDISKVSGIKLPNGHTLGSMLNNNTPAANDVKDAITRALSPSSDTTDFQQTFNEEIAALNTLLKKDPPTFPAETIALHLVELKAKAKTAIENQQRQTKADINNLFADAHFVNDLKTSLTIGDDEVAHIKDQMLSALDKQHKEEIGPQKQKINVEKAFENNANLLLQNAQSERIRVATLGALYKMNKDAIDALANKQGIPNQPTILTTNFETGDISLKGVRIQDLATINTVTGQKLLKQGDGEYTLKTPRSLLNPFYHSSRHKNVLYDLTTMAQAIRACGYDSITLSVKYKPNEVDQEGNPRSSKTLEYARQAYEAARRAGFAADKITIVVNDKPMKAEQIFRKHSNKLELINLHAEKEEQLRQYYGLSGAETSCGFSKVSEVPKDDQLSKYKKSEYFLTDKGLFYYSKLNNQLQTIDVTPEQLQQLNHEFSQMKKHRTDQLSHDELMKIATITGHTPDSTKAILDNLSSKVNPSMSSNLKSEITKLRNEQHSQPQPGPQLTT